MNRVPASQTLHFFHRCPEKLLGWNGSAAGFGWYCEESADAFPGQTVPPRVVMCEGRE